MSTEMSDTTLIGGFSKAFLEVGKNRKIKHLGTEGIFLPGIY
jgi:hypothetical protein